jgi:hypothetical protein
MEAVKCTISDTLVAKSTQHVVQKYALTITFFSCIHIGLEWDGRIHHFPSYRNRRHRESNLGHFFRSFDPLPGLKE